MKIVKMDTRAQYAKPPYSLEQVFFSDFLPHFGGTLRTGKKIPSCNLLPRELLGLIVTSSFISAHTNRFHTIGIEHPPRFDGLVIGGDEDEKSMGTRTALYFEQVYVPPQNGQDIPLPVRIERSFWKKRGYGLQYTKGINLIVLSEEPTPLNIISPILDTLSYEMVIVINACPPIPYVFDVMFARNDDKVGQVARLTLDRLTAIRQVNLLKGKILVMGNTVALRCF